jgi:hypothetical protein
MYSRHAQVTEHYYVAVRNKAWHVLDSDGYEVAYVSYDTKKEAVAAAKVREQDDKREAIAHAAFMRGME